MKKILGLAILLSIGSSAIAMENGSDNNYINLRKVILSIRVRLNRIENDIKNISDDKVKKEFNALYTCIDKEVNTPEVKGKYIEYNEYCVLHERVAELEKKTDNAIGKVISTIDSNVHARVKNDDFLEDNDITTLSLPENCLNETKLKTEQPIKSDLSVVSNDSQPDDRQTNADKNSNPLPNQTLKKELPKGLCLRVFAIGGGVGAFGLISLGTAYYFLVYKKKQLQNNPDVQQETMPHGIIVEQLPPSAA